MTSSAWRERARAACRRDAVNATVDEIVEAPPPSTRVLTETWLSDLGGFPPLPPDAGREDVDEHRLLFLRFFHLVRAAVLARTGRWFRLEPKSDGAMVLLTPEESAREVPNRARREGDRALVKGVSRLRQIPRHMTDPEALKSAADEQAALGAFLHIIRGRRVAKNNP